MKQKTLKLATAVAVGVLSTSAFSATMMANNSNKGSLLVFPRIDVRSGFLDYARTIPCAPGVCLDNPLGATFDTLVTMVNDSSVNVNVKCYYRSSEPLMTPMSSKTDVSLIKHTMDFTFPLTKNQTITWSATTGVKLGGGGQVASPFTGFPDGSARETGELKCWAVGSDPQGNIGQINFNQLFGNAVIVNNLTQAWEYNAWAFQAIAGTGAQGQLVGTPGIMNLDGSLTGYDFCPNILLTDFQPGGFPTPPTGVAYTGGLPHTNISIAGCNQDLTQPARPVITKYVFTFWNQDEFSRTGTHECADSWYESYLTPVRIGRAATGPVNTSLNGLVGASALPNDPITGAVPGLFGMPLAQYTALGTPEAYMRVESVSDAAVCFGSVHVGMLGTVSHDNANVYLRGSNMIGRGTQVGVITWTPGPADGAKK